MEIRGRRFLYTTSIPMTLGLAWLTIMVMIESASVKLLKTLFSLEVVMNPVDF